jgi:plastocyanin
MRYWTLSMVCAMAVLVTGLTARSVAAEDEGNIATVSFGIGLNTALPPPNGEPNHHILPQTVRIKQGGVVNFMVAGFHQIVAYRPGTRLDDLVVPGAGTFVNDPLNVYYTGIVPAGGPPPGIPATANPSNAMNRVESVAFLEPGTYLVICNVRGHLLDGMYAYVIVSRGNDRGSND